MSKYEVKILKDLPYVADGCERQVLDLYIPVGKKDCSVFVFFHGGGFEKRSKEDPSYSRFVREMAEDGVACALPNYRMYPDNKYPAFIDDAAAATAFVHKHMGEYADFNGKVFIGGHSAGGYQAMMLLFAEEFLNKYGMTPADLSGCIFASGQPTTHFNVLRERGINPNLAIIDDAAPMYHFKKLEVPMLVTVVEDEIENRILQTDLFVNTLKSIEYPGEIIYKYYKGYTHNNCFQLDEDPGCKCVVHPDILAFIEKYSK